MRGVQSVTASPLFNDVAPGLTASMCLPQPQPMQPVHLVVVLDKSGSMTGQPFAEACSAVCAFYKEVLASCSLSASTLIPFSTYASSRDLTSHRSSSRGLEQVIEGLYAEGSTNFKHALDTLNCLISASKDNTYFFVVFFTDGMDTSGLSSGGYSSYSSYISYSSYRNLGNAIEDDVLQQVGPSYCHL